MTAPAVTRKGVSTFHVLLIAFATFIIGVMLTIGAAAIHRWITDDSRPQLTIADVIVDDEPAFANAGRPSKEACGSERSGCVEGLVGDGVAIYRYASLDFAREATTYGDGDFYRSDRLVLEFDGSLTPDERFFLLQGVEGSFTGSPD